MTTLSAVQTPALSQPFDPTAMVSEESLREGLEPRRDGLDDARRRRAVERVAAMYRACKRDQPAASAPYQPGGEWADYLAERREVYDALLRNDLPAAESKLRGFWRNELGPIVKEYAKYEQLIDRVEPNTSRFMHNVCRNYLIWREIVGGSVRDLSVPLVGEPWGYFIDGELIVPKATRFHALASQVGELVRGVERPTVAEIGAGYGGMAYYLLRDTPGVRYVDFDLPETLVLAAYYLLCALPERRVALYGEFSGGMPSDAEVVLLPNFALPSLPSQSVDVFVNTFSLSEVPWETLEEYVRQIERGTRGFFLHNNMDRQGVINRGFERIPASRYPIDAAKMRLIYKRFDLFHGQAGDYRECLYQRLPGEVRGG